MQIEVSDLFTSIQGEGRHSYRPSVFVRLRRCNLACVWCDTKYTWDKTDKGFDDFFTEPSAGLAKLIRIEKENGVSVQLQLEIAEALGPRAGLLSATEVSNLVFTGGEPLIWKPYIEQVLNDLLPIFHSVEIETNGTIPPLPQTLNARFNISYNVSPKLFHSGNDPEFTVQLPIWKQFTETGRSYWKFVVNSDEQQTRDIELYVITLVTLGGVRKQDIMLMPLGDSVEELTANTPFAMTLAEGLGISTTDRKHVRVWGAERAR